MKRLNDHLSVIPLDEATRPPRSGYYFHYKDSWWTVDADGNPCFYAPKVAPSMHAAGQCNADENAARMLNKRLWPDLDVVFLPSVFQPIDPSDLV